MKETYIFEYLNENEFRKRERSVRKYNMLAYKKLTFEYYPEIRTKNAELIEVRDALRMEDIMTSCNKFKYLQQ